MIILHASQPEASSQDPFALFAGTKASDSLLKGIRRHVLMGSDLGHRSIMNTTPRPLAIPSHPTFDLINEELTRGRPGLFNSTLPLLQRKT